MFVGYREDVPSHHDSGFHLQRGWTTLKVEDSTRVDLAQSQLNDETCSQRKISKTYFGCPDSASASEDKGNVREQRNHGKAMPSLGVCLFCIRRDIEEIRSQHPTFSMLIDVVLASNAS